MWTALPATRPADREGERRAVPVPTVALDGAPCTTTIRRLPSEVLLRAGEDPVPLDSAVNLDSVESVSIGTLTERLGRLADPRMREVCEAPAVAVDCD